jgi:hypothetical protein
MNNEIRLRRIGIEKAKVFDSNFDKVYDYYKDKAEQLGYWGELKFIRERNKVIIYTIIDLPEINDDDINNEDLYH